MKELQIKTSLNDNDINCYKETISMNFVAPYSFIKISKNVAFKKSSIKLLFTLLNFAYFSIKL